jgi:hypothetical protein
MQRKSNGIGRSTEIRAERCPAPCGHVVSLAARFGSRQSGAVITFGDMAKDLNRSTVYLSGLQKRFELPVLAGAAYSPAYAAFLRSVIAFRTFDIAEETLRDLWHLEKKLLHLLHVDSTGSRTWFLDACGRTTHRERRLMLSNFDLGIPLDAREVQAGLDFSDRLPELFEGKEMGEDALRVLRECLKIRAKIMADITTELPCVREAVKWAAHLPK